MVRNSALRQVLGGHCCLPDRQECLSHRLGRLPRHIWMLLTCAVMVAVHAGEVPKPTPKPDEKTPKPADKDKGAGPEHNVTLMEEPGVKDLFNKAAKARAKAEKEPEAWRDCVIAYGDILKKY